MASWKLKKQTRVKCARSSYRSRDVAKGKKRLVFCCPKGKWKRGRCTVGMKLHAEKVKR